MCEIFAKMIYILCAVSLITPKLAQVSIGFGDLDPLSMSKAK